MDELVAITEWCKGQNIILHLDGARLWECSPYYKKAIAGPEDFIKEVKVWQRRQCGNLIALYPYIVSARMSLHLRLDKMKAYHEKAREVVKVLSTIKGIKIVPAIPQASMVHIFSKEMLSGLKKLL